MGTECPLVDIIHETTICLPSKLSSTTDLAEPEKPDQGDGYWVGTGTGTQIELGKRE